MKAYVGMRLLVWPTSDAVLAEVVHVTDKYLYCKDISNSNQTKWRNVSPCFYDKSDVDADVRARVSWWFQETHGKFFTNTHTFRILPPRNEPTIQFGDDT